MPRYGAFPADHAVKHEDTKIDEVNVGGLSGLLADDQHVLDAEVLLVAAALVHKLRHQNAGADEISVADLSGLLADDQHVLDAEVLAVAVNKAGDTGLGRNFRRVVDNDYVTLHGGLTQGAYLDLFGKDCAGMEGKVQLVVPNAAGDGTIVAFALSGKTDTPEMTAGIIPNARLKTAVAFAIGNLTPLTHLNLTMQDYSFSPNIYADPPGNTVIQEVFNAYNADQVGRFGLYNTHAANTYGYKIHWRYITASNEPEIWIGLDKDGRIIAVWIAEDPSSVRPPIDSEGIVKLIRLNPDSMTFKSMREVTKDRLGSVILNEGRIEKGKLTFGEFSFDVEVMPKEDVPKMKRVTKEVTKQVLVKVPQLVTESIFNQWTGKFEDREVELTESVERDHYFLDAKGKVQKERVVVEETVMVEITEDVVEEVEEWAPT